MSGTYFWKDEDVLVVSRQLKSLEAQPYYGLYCVDAYYPEPSMKYGTFTNRGWSPQPLDSFPKEFRMHLLLLGVG